MWNYQMWPNDSVLLGKFAKHSTIAGIIMAILGILAIIYPFAGSLFAVAFVAWLMIFGGVITGYATARTNPKDWLGWFKAFILLLTGGLMIFKPAMGIQALALVMAIYFLLDAFGGFAMGALMRPAKGWWLWSLNGLLSLVLAVIFLASWVNVAQTAWLIGIFVGISLLFDGIVLLFMGSQLKKLAK
jgi:uncharacterized membrane protein HdeD (DUF308 family)